MGWDAALSVEAASDAALPPPRRSGGALPEGVQLLRLRDHPDERGVFTELFRDEWSVGPRPVQWNAVRSRAGTLRGVHVHPVHDDYLTVIDGRAAIGLRDLRAGSPTEGRTTVVELDGGEPSAILIPHGVAHGFLFLTDAVHIYAVSHTWDPRDELGCRWDDPALGIDWPQQPTSVSGRDRALPTLAELLAELEQRRG